MNNIQSLLEPFEKLGRDREFWNHTLDGIAVLGSPGLFQVYGLQQPVPELAGQSRCAHFQGDGKRFSFSMGRRPHSHRVVACYHYEMNMILLVVVLLLLFGGGGFYFGGPLIGGGGIGLILLICLVIYFMGGFRGSKS